MRLHALLLSALLAGAASASISVNGTDIFAGPGDGWVVEQTPYDSWSLYVNLTNSGPFVVSGTDVSGKIILCAKTDCTVVVSNLVLSNAASGHRLHGDGIGCALAVATNGTGRSVAVFPDGLYWSSLGIGTFFPDEPAASYCSQVFTWSDVWDPSNISWTPHETNSAAVVWAGERFVAARFRGGFMVSDDGSEWSPASWNGTPYNLRAIARNPDSGTLVAASTKGLWASRDGGLSWSQATNHWANAVVWEDGLFVAVGYDKGAGPQAVYWSSDDGATWRARTFSDMLGELMFVVAGGGGSFLSGNANGWRALRFENGDLAETRTKSFSGSKFAIATGGGRYVACAILDSGLRVSTNGVDWTRADKRDGTFASIVWKNGRFLAEGVAANNDYDGLWSSTDGASWTRLPDEIEQGVPALDCNTHDVSLAISGTGNGLEGGLYAPAVRIGPGGSLDVSAQGSAPAALQAFGGRYAAAFGGGLDEGAGAFVQRSATLLAVGGAYAPDIGSGRGGPTAEGVTILGGSLFPAGWRIDPVPSNGVEAVRCVVVQGLAPGSSVSLANLPEGYGTDGVVADASGRVYLWLPAAAESFRFIADGKLRRVAAGNEHCLVETLPDPKVEAATFAAPTNGTMEVTIRVSSPVEAEALAPFYAADLSALSSGGGDPLAPTSVRPISDDEYELTFRLPADSPSGFLLIQAN